MSDVELKIRVDSGSATENLAELREALDGVAAAAERASVALNKLVHRQVEVPNQISLAEMLKLNAPAIAKIVAEQARNFPPRQR
jgi:hypothetical protein